jgi:mono/diheme cytochrome c family protein
VAAAVLTLVGARAHAQPSSAVPQQRSSRDSVYSVAQALAGKDLYAGRCASCHSVVSHTGVPFRNNWNGRPLFDLFVFIRDKMPKNDPGSLGNDEIIIAMSYILKMNGMPAGEAELTDDPDSLKAIRIDAPPPPAATPKAKSAGKAPATKPPVTKRP